MEKGILGRVACCFHGGAAAHYVSFLILTRGKAYVTVPVIFLGFSCRSSSLPRALFAFNEVKPGKVFFIFFGKIHHKVTVGLSINELK